ncbi:WD40 repeat domain-containing protein [Candidatus Poribacteria bacterium]
MCWQNSRDWIVRYIIVFLIGISSISLTSAQEFIPGTEELVRGIFSPDGELLAIPTASAKVFVLDTGFLRLIMTLSTQGRSAYALAFSPDSRYLAWNEGMGGGLGVWDLSTSKQVAYFRLNALTIDALVFVPGGELLAANKFEEEWAGGTRGVVHFWKVGTWEKHGDWRAPGNTGVGNLAFTHDGKLFAASSTRGPVGEWVHEESFVDVQTLKTVELRKRQDAGIMAYSPDGRFEVVQLNGGRRSVLIRDPQDHAQIAILSDPAVGYLVFRSISPDGKWLSTTNEQVILWNTQTWEIEYRLDLPVGERIAQGAYYGVPKSALFGLPPENALISKLQQFRL